MEKILKRTLYSTLISAMAKNRIFVILGARQVGKTTLIKKILGDLRQNGIPEKNILSISFDDPEIRKKISHDPSYLFEMLQTAFGETINKFSSQKYLFIDEAQKCPQSFDAIKILFDNHKEKIRIILTGSSSLNLMKKTSETLAGRLSIFRLYPLSWEEIISNFISDHLSGFSLIENILSKKMSYEKILSVQSDIIGHKNEILFYWKKYLLSGGLPEIFVQEETQEISRLFDNYIKTYLESDIKSLKQIGNENLFLNVLDIFILRDTNILNSSNLASETGVNRLTLNKYLEVLRETFIVSPLSPFVKVSKQSTKSPKTYLFDHGISIYKKKIFSLEQLELSESIGVVFENIAINSIFRSFANNPQSPNINFWRDYQDHEIDVIISDNDNIVPIEISHSQKISSQKINNFKAFYRQFPEANDGFLIWSGDLKKIKIADKNIIAIPFWLWF